MNTKSSKAYFRSGQALVHLGKLEEALDCCQRCLSYDSTNAGIKVLQDRAIKLKEERDRKEQEKMEQKRKEEYSKMVMKAALRVSVVSM